ncbi:unnamed protein product [Linum trigynum]|uniref:KIB1-4 beta-propeller domain-containing protein n=1 Tax=Linum trigynum TaxID=586398 RepID=A0AAV2C708_9ROSI
MISRDEPNWSDLSGEILHLISNRVTKMKDFIRLQAVCNPWRRALAQSRFSQSIPWLMLPYCRNSIVNNDTCAAAVGCKNTEYCRCLYDLEEKRFQHIELPQGLNKTGRGSAFGWLFMMESSPSLVLLNPFTKCQIPLPPATGFPNVLEFRSESVGREYLHLDFEGLQVTWGKKEFESNYIDRVCLSAEPTSEDSVVMVIPSLVGTLVFCKVNGDQKWTLIPGGNDVDLPKQIHFLDVVFWRGQFYALSQDEKVYVCDLSLPHCPTLSLFLDGHKLLDVKGSKYYLLTSSNHNELMMVNRYVRDPDDKDDDDDDNDNNDDDEWTDDDDYDDDDYDEDVSELDPHDEVHHSNIDNESDDDDQLATDGRRQQREYVRESQLLTCEFKVFVAKEDKKGWDEVDSIGNFALFLGSNTATWISITEHPELASNSIYFTDDKIEVDCERKHAGADMGVYNLTTRTINRFYSTPSVHKNPSLILPLPLWISPSNY